MADEIEYVPLEEPAAAGQPREPDLHHLHDVPVELAVEIGRTSMTIGETLKLGPGSIVSLNRLAGEPVDLLVNGKPIARGEVVVIDEEFGLRITDIVSGADRVAEADQAALAAPESGASDPALAPGDDVAAYLGNGAEPPAGAGDPLAAPPAAAPLDAPDPLDPAAAPGEAPDDALLDIDAAPEELDVSALLDDMPDLDEHDDGPAA